MPLPIEDAPTKGEIRVCCPPITQQSFQPYFRVHQLAGKNITQTYGLEFLPTAALDAQMQAYAPFAGLFAPLNWTANSVLLDSDMKELTIPATGTPTPGDWAAATATVFHGKLRGWWATGTGVWNGMHGSHTWDQHYKDGMDVSPSYMQPNKWYMIKLNLKLASKLRPGDQSWREDAINCMTKYVAVIVRSVGFKTGAGAGIPADSAQIVEIN